MLGANLETKARCADLSAVARLAAQIGARYEGRLDQVDTYFDVSPGRLKLRELTHHLPDGHLSASVELIRYERPDQAGPRVSRYDRTGITDVESCRARLAAAHGVRGVVCKRRELWTLKATRIHLDRLDELGDFVELETVASGEPGTADRLEHDRIAAALELDPGATVDCSYIDLLAPPSMLLGEEARREAPPGRPSAA